MGQPRFTAVTNSVIATFITFVLQIIGIASPYWSHFRIGNYGFVSMGLWQVCIHGTCVSNNLLNLFVGFIMISKILVTSSMAVTGLCLFMAIIACKSNARSTKRCLLLLAGLLMILAGLATASGCGMFGLSMPQLSWAFSITCASSFMAIISAIFMFVARTKVTDEVCEGMVIMEGVSLSPVVAFPNMEQGEQVLYNASGQPVAYSVPGKSGHDGPGVINTAGQPVAYSVPGQDPYGGPGVFNTASPGYDNIGHDKSDYHGAPPPYQ